MVKACMLIITKKALISKFGCFTSLEPRLIVIEQTVNYPPILEVCT